MPESSPRIDWPPLLSDRQTAEYLGGVSKAIVWRWSAAGELPKPIHLPGRVTRWVREELDAVIARWAAAKRK